WLPPPSLPRSAAPSCSPSQLHIAILIAVDLHPTHPSYLLCLAPRASRARAATDTTLRREDQVSPLVPWYAEAERLAVLDLIHGQECGGAVRWARSVDRRRADEGTAELRAGACMWARAPVLGGRVVGDEGPTPIRLVRAQDRGAGKEGIRRHERAFSAFFLPQRREKKREDEWGETGRKREESAGWRRTKQSPRDQD
ncbi:unnamed protein product, partial [Urochloa humidicola]